MIPHGSRRRLAWLGARRVRRIEGRPWFAVALLTATLIWSRAPAAAQTAPTPEEPLSLEQAVAQGLRHNQALRAAGQEVAAAGQRVVQARSAFFPTLNAGYTWKHYRDQPYVSFSGAGLQSVPSQLPSDYTTTNRWQVEVDQPLFTGFGLVSRFKIAELGRDAARYQEEQARLDLVRGIKYAFLQTLLAEKLLTVAGDNVKSLEVHKRNAESYYEQGLTPRNDVLKAEVALAEAEQQKRGAERQVRVVRARLNQLLGLDLDTSLRLRGEEVKVRPIPELEALYARARQSRPEVLAVEATVHQAEEEARAARSGYFPRFSVFGQYYREGHDFLAESNQFHNPDNAIVGLRMDWNLFQGGETAAKVQEADYRGQGLRDRLRDLRLQVDLEVKEAYEQVSLAAANISTSKVALEQAKESERITTLQYKEQLVIFLEVLNSQVFVLQSQVNYYQALYGYRLALADLERAIGGFVPPLGL